MCLTCNKDIADVLYTYMHTANIVSVITKPMSVRHKCEMRDGSIVMRMLFIMFISMCDVIGMRQMPNTPDEQQEQKQQHAHSCPSLIGVMLTFHEIPIVEVPFMI